MSQILEHPVLEHKYTEEITIYFNGNKVKGKKGQTIAAILTASGIKNLGHTRKKKATRGIFCGIGQCGNCMMIVDGKPNVRVCITDAVDGMRVEEQ